MIDQTVTVAGQASLEDREYDEFLARLQVRFLANLVDSDAKLYTTDAPDLFPLYLAAFPDAQRQYHNCNACSRFLHQYGSLATIGADGELRPAIWHIDDAPPYYRPPVKAITRAVAAARVTGVFVSDENRWGIPQNKDGRKQPPVTWQHLSVTPPAAIVRNSRIETPAQFMAERREDYRLLRGTLDKYSLAVIETVLSFLETNTLARGDKFEGKVRWLRDLHVARTSARGFHSRRAENIVWRAVATAPPFFARIGSSVVGEILDGVVAGDSLETLKRRFASMVDGVTYQRAQTAPDAQTLERAEKAFAALGLAPSLARRYAYMPDVIEYAVWKPPVAKEVVTETPPSIFGHIKTKETQAVAAATQAYALQPTTVTWVKFAADVLPSATKIEYLTDRYARNYCGFLTAADPAAPPILVWDKDDCRNPVSAYCYRGGSIAEQFNISTGAWVNIPAILFDPAHFGRTVADKLVGEHALHLVLEGAKDLRRKDGKGLSLFPESLKSELKPYRSVVEAFSNTGTLVGDPVGSVCTIAHAAGATWRARLRVTSGATIKEYILDRWD